MTARNPAMSFCGFAANEDRGRQRKQRKEQEMFERMRGRRQQARYGDRRIGAWAEPQVWRHGKPDAEHERHGDFQPENAASGPEEQAPAGGDEIMTDWEQRSDDRDLTGHGEHPRRGS